MVVALPRSFDLMARRSLPQARRLDIANGYSAHHDLFDFFDRRESEPLRNKWDIFETNFSYFISEGSNTALSRGGRA